MIIAPQTRKLLKKVGFVHIHDTKHQSFWITPISGRILIVSDMPILEAPERLFPFGGIQIPSGSHSFVISNLMAKFDPSEHSLIDILIEHE